MGYSENTAGLWQENFLVLQAYLLRYSYKFYNFQAVFSSNIEPLPHQIIAVYDDMLSMPRPLRYCLADDPGSGKTIMAGLLIKELLLQRHYKHILIVAPGNLAEQWQEELSQKFFIHSHIVGSISKKTATLIKEYAEANIPENENDFCKDSIVQIARLDTLSRSTALQKMLKSIRWDLAIIDEAHKMSATIWSKEIHYTKRYVLGQLISANTNDLLLMTATPHNGKEAEFRLFMSLLDDMRYCAQLSLACQPKFCDVHDVMRRLMKEDLLKFDGQKLFVPRVAITVNYDLSPAEVALYNAVTKYVRDGFNKAMELSGRNMITIGFALMVLQRRLASSPEAIYQSLHKRRCKLMGSLSLLQDKNTTGSPVSLEEIKDIADDDTVVNAQTIEEAEEAVVNNATASQSVNDYTSEIETLQVLEAQADRVRQSGLDRKWEELSRLLLATRKIYGNGYEKLIIFTEHRDTLRYLAKKIASLLEDAEAVATIHGGLSRKERQAVQSAFCSEKKPYILVATDAAGEGINLQEAYLMVNYDIPWNPNRLEQRFGRIHRIGQTHTCHLWNMISSQTREGMVFSLLLKKLEQEGASLNGKVFDVLGKVKFNNKPLRDLFIEAVRYDSMDITQHFSQEIEQNMSHTKIQKIITQNDVVLDKISPESVKKLKQKLDDSCLMQPKEEELESFFVQGFSLIGGSIESTLFPHCYTITYLPAILQRFIPKREYKDVCFSKEFSIKLGYSMEYLSLCHPLFCALLDYILSEKANNLLSGFAVKNTQENTSPYVLYYIEDNVVTGFSQNDFRHIASKKICIIKQTGEDEFLQVAPPNLKDFVPINSQEVKKANAIINDNFWLNTGDNLAIDYVKNTVSEEHLSQVKKRDMQKLLTKQKQLRESFFAQINYYDFRADDIVQNNMANDLSAKNAAKFSKMKANHLREQKDVRLECMDKELDLKSVLPSLKARLVVLPAFYFNEN